MCLFWITSYCNNTRSVYRDNSTGIRGFIMTIMIQWNLSYPQFLYVSTVSIIHGKKSFPNPNSPLMGIGGRPVFTPEDSKEQVMDIILRGYSTLVLHSNCYNTCQRHITPVRGVVTPNVWLKVANTATQTLRRIWVYLQIHQLHGSNFAFPRSVDMRGFTVALFTRPS